MSGYLYNILTHGALSRNSHCYFAPTEPEVI